MMGDSILQMEARAGYFDIDPMLRYTATAYWRTLQNAAAAHAAALGVATEDLRRRGQTWMLSKMAVEVDRAPALGESFAVETWPSTKLRGVRAVRDFLVRSGAEVLARATSLWVIVDLASRKPLRVPEEIVRLRCDREFRMPEFREELGVAGIESGQRHFRAEWSDADQNEHVNNVSYVRWAVDALPRSYLERHQLRRIEVHYRQEVQLGQELVAHWSVDGLRVGVELGVAQGQVAECALEWEPCPDGESS